VCYLKLFTKLPPEEIHNMEGWTGADVNRPKIVLADEATALLHGRECFEGIRETLAGILGSSGVGGGGEGGGGRRFHRGIELRVSVQG
jgi:tyrosyl-tRNA synthetase